MFATRFDPTEFGKQEIVANERKRRLSESENESESESESESSESNISSADVKESDKDISDSDIKDSDKSDSDIDIDEEEESNSHIEDTIEETVSNTDHMDIDTPKKHESVLKRFQKTISKQSNSMESDESSEEEYNDDVNDLAPIPQPELPTDQRLSSLSSLNGNLNWLTKPIYYQTDLLKPFTEISPPINPIIINNLQKHFEITDAFSVQVSVIETLMRDIETNKLTPNFQGDLLVNASTGSGKTLAYCVPLVLALQDRVVPKLRCIILVPTKPLIQQVRSTLFNLTKGLNINIMTFKSDISIREELQKFLQNTPDIVISTPGRLVDHLPDLDLTYLRYLIIDEADRLLNQSFQNWCDLLISKLHTQQLTNSNIWHLQCSKLIFSATLTTNAEKLSHLKLTKPRLIVINNRDQLVNELYQLPPRVKECYIRINSGLNYHKPLILFKFLTNYKNKDDEHRDFSFNKNVLIFTKSNEASLRLTRLLTLLSNKFQITLKISSINSLLKNQDRQRILQKFESNEIDVLISTDLISRGLNLSNIKTVLNYDLPLSSKDYIHRIGRTARANKFGYAVSFIYGVGEWKFMSKTCLFNRAINRNDNQVNKINVVRRQNHTDESKEPGFELELEEFEKKIYDDCLLELENEVFDK